jgi:hypothetical protein
LAFLKSKQVARLVVGLPLDPASVEDANPLESEGSERGLVAHAACATALVEGVRPEGARDGLGDPLDEGLTENLGHE